jgi:hypothetical protein
MLKRLSEAYAIPFGAVVVLSISGLIAFSVVIGLATFSGLVTLWPDMSVGLAITLATIVPLVLILGVGCVCAAHDKCASNPRTAPWLKAIKWFVPAVVIVYLLFESIRPWL